MSTLHIMITLQLNKNKWKLTAVTKIYNSDVEMCPITDRFCFYIMSLNLRYFYSAVSC